MPTNATELVSIHECARVLGVPVTSLFYHIKAKKSNYTQVKIGSTIGVKPSEFGKYMQERNNRKAVQP